MLEAIVLGQSFLAGVHFSRCNSPRWYRLTTVSASGHVGYRQVLNTGDGPC